MASTYTLNTGIEKPGTGEQSGTWGNTTNTNFDIIDRALSGVGAITLTGTSHTLTTTDGSLTDGMFKVLVLGGSPSGTNTITIGDNTQDKLYFVVNNSGQEVQFSQGTGSNATIANGAADIIYADGAGSGAAVASFFGTALKIGTDVTVGDDLTLKSDSAVLGFGADTDTTLTHTDGTGLTLNSTNKLTFGDTASFIHQSSNGVLTIDGEATIDLNASTAVLVSHDLKLDSDGAILGFGADNDVTLTHVHNTGLTLNDALTTNDDITISAGNPTLFLAATGDGGEGSIGFKDDDGNIDGKIAYRTDYASNTDNYMTFNTGGSERVRIDSAGNVGIGTASPSAQLHIDEGTSNTHAILRLEGNNRGGKLEMYQGTLPVAIIQADQSGNLSFNTSGAFGNSSVTTKLEVETAGDVNVKTGDLLFGTAGKGVNLGVTSNTDSNTLDDYEEGTYTLGMNGFAFQTNSTGRYIKIGKFVHFTAFIHALGSQNTNTATLDLPFTVDANTASSNSGYYTIAMAHVSTHNVDTGSIGMSWVSTGGSSNIILHQQNEDGSRTQAQNNVFTSEDTMYLSGTFIASS